MKVIRKGVFFELLAIAVGVLVTSTSVEADSGGLPRNCQLNQLKENPRNPHTFYWCLIDGPVLMKCLDSLVFDAGVGKCVEQQRRKDKRASLEEHENHWNSRSRSSLVVPSKEPSAPKCPDDWTEEAYFPSEECGKFYQCSNGRLVLQSCPKGLQFNRKLNVCLWQRDAGCKQQDQGATPPRDTPWASYVY